MEHVCSTSSITTTVYPETSERLQRAVEDFVAARRALSDKDLKPAWFNSWKDTVDHRVFVDRSMGGDYACWPADILSTVLPFFEARPSGKKVYRAAKVPVKFVVGSSWRWDEGGLPDEKLYTVDSAIKLFTQDRCASPGGIGAQVAHVVPLGIFYVTCEGKNRVAFLARHGVELMPCMLCERDYPAVDRLRLIAVREGPLCTWLCVLDGEFATTIAYPEFTLPILRAYGVKNVEWSESFPMQATVMNSFRLQAGDRDGAMRNGPTGAVSFSDLKRRELEVQQPSEKRAALLGHTEVNFDFKFFRNVLGFMVAVLVCGIVLRAVKLRGDDAMAILGFGLGGLVGMLAMLSLPVARRAQPLERPQVAERAANGTSGPPRSFGAVGEGAALVPGEVGN